MRNNQDPPSQYVQPLSPALPCLCVKADGGQPPAAWPKEHAGCHWEHLVLVKDDYVAGRWVRGEGVEKTGEDKDKGLLQNLTILLIRGKQHLS